MLKLLGCTRLMASLCAVAVVGVVSTGCASRRAPVRGAVGIGGPLLIQMDSAVYTARRVGSSLHVELGATLTNQSNEPVYFPCEMPRPPGIFKKENDRWVVVYATLVGGCKEGPLILAPGESYYYHYPLRATLPGYKPNPVFKTTVPGTYRLQWSDIYLTWAPRDSVPGVGVPVPDSLLYTNEFELREE